MAETVPPVSPPPPPVPVFNPFAPAPVQRRPIGVAVNAILARVGTCAQNMVSTYLAVQKDIHECADGYTAEEIIKVLGPRYQTLVEFAILDKTISNRYQKDRIVDGVPEAIIVMPTDPKYAEVQALLAE